MDRGYIERRLARLQPGIPLLFLAFAPEAWWERADAILTLGGWNGVPALVLRCECQRNSLDNITDHSHYEVASLPANGKWGGPAHEIDEELAKLIVVSVQKLAKSIASCRAAKGSSNEPPKSD